jgi:transcriptional regulator with GAF, ATPase, and Fis domain
LDALHSTIEQLIDEQLGELVALEDANLQINAQIEFQYVMDTVLEWAMLVSSAVAGTLYLLSFPHAPVQERQTLHAVAQHGYGPQTPKDQGHQRPIGQDIVAHALESGQAVHQAHTAQDVSRSGPRDQDQAHLALPIRHGDRPLGVFVLESALADGFTSPQIDSATRLTEHAALAIQNALVHRQTLAAIDELLVIHRACLHLTVHLDLETLPGEIVKRALAILGADRAALYLHDESTDAFTNAAVLNQVDRSAPPAEITERDLVEAVAREKTARFEHHPPASTLVALPLVPEPLHKYTTQAGQIKGILCLSYDTHDQLAPERQDTVRLFADYVSSALQNALQARDTLHAYKDHLNSVSRSPLTAIQGYANLMLQQIGGEITDQQQEFLETILRNALSLGTSLDDQAVS